MSKRSFCCKIQVDSKRKKFYFSAPIYEGTASLPHIVANFLFAQLQQPNCHCFEKKSSITMGEEISFSWGSQPTTRQQLYYFIRRLCLCRHHFSMLAQFRQM
jgi:hypothetical protein